MRSLVRTLGVVAALAIAGCAAEAPGTAVCETAPVRTGIVRALGFVESSGVVSDGFNIDGLVGSGSDPNACRVRDFITEDGRNGIDNQVALLVPIIRMMIGDAVEGIIAGAIGNGMLLLTFTVEGADTLPDDACVTLAVTTATGTPILGTDGLLQPGQTLYESPGAPVNRFVGATIEDGVLEAGPFDVQVPLALLNALFTLTLHDARVRITIAEDGSMRGMIGGGVEIEELVGNLERTEGVPLDLLEMIEGFLHTVADLNPVDGDCSQFSTTLAFEAVPGFLVAE